MVERLREYVEYLKKQKVSGYVPNAQDQSANYYVHSDKNISSRINEIDQVVDIDERIKLVEEMIKNLTLEEQQKLEQKNMEEQKKEKVINIKDIDHLKLQNGQEVYSFIDANGNRKLVQNSRNGDLNTQLSGDMLEIDELEQNNDMVNLVQIDEFLGDTNNFRGLDEYQMENVKKLIESKDSLNIKYFNRDNMVAVDENGKVLEVYYDQNDRVSKISEPNSFNYQKSSLDANNNVNSNINEVQSNNVENKEDNNVDLKEGEEVKGKDFLSPEEQSAIKAEIEEKGINVSVNDAYSNIPMYYENPIKIEEDFKSGLLDEQAKEFYEDMTSMHAENNAKTNNIAKQQTLVYTMPTDEKVSSDQKGIASIFIVAIVLFVVAAIILFIMN